MEDERVFLPQNMHFRLPGETIKKIKECIEYKMTIENKRASMTDVVRWGVDRMHKEYKELMAKRFTEK